MVSIPRRDQTHMGTNTKEDIGIKISTKSNHCVFLRRRIEQGKGFHKQKSNLQDAMLLKLKICDADHLCK